MPIGIVSLTILSDIGKAIRHVNGLNTRYAPGDMPSAIRALKNTFGSKTVLENGTYTAAADNLDGYSEIIIAVRQYGHTFESSAEKNNSYIIGIAASEYAFSGMSWEASAAEETT